MHDDLLNALEETIDRLLALVRTGVATDRDRDELERALEVITSASKPSPMSAVRQQVHRVSFTDTQQDP